MENKLITDFSQVIKSKNIVIPIIQRDYAQGRIDPSINSIRKKFIDSLFAAVHDNKEMDINYIYGINKQGDVFLPIDGQQRLTSIYLFLWFCAVKEGKTEEFCKYTKSFSYQVRETSENFFPLYRRKKAMSWYIEMILRVMSMIKK